MLAPTGPDQSSTHLTAAADNDKLFGITPGSSMPKVGEQIAKGEKRLTPPQQKFLDNYIHKDMTQTPAARDAGYKNPNVSAVQLLNHPRVKERMEEMRQELEAKYGVSVTKSVRDMQRLRDEAW